MQPANVPVYMLSLYIVQLFFSLLACLKFHSMFNYCLFDACSLYIYSYAFYRKMSYYDSIGCSFDYTLLARRQHVTVFGNFRKFSYSVCVFFVDISMM